MLVALCYFCFSQTVSNVDKDLDAVVSILNDFEVNEILKALINSLAFLNKFTGVHDPGRKKCFVVEDFFLNLVFFSHPEESELRM